MECNQGSCSTLSPFTRPQASKFAGIALSSHQVDTTSAFRDANLLRGCFALVIGNEDVFQNAFGLQFLCMTKPT